jgi:hypothetical protein
MRAATHPVPVTQVAPVDRTRVFFIHFTSFRLRLYSVTWMKK